MVSTRAASSAAKMASSEIGVALKSVLRRIDVAAGQREGGAPPTVPRLVAVSKTKPVSAIVDCYRAGQRHFGENYAKELLVKAADGDVLRLCPDIRWHFVGPTTRRSTAKVLARCPNLFVVETIGGRDAADALDEALGKRKRDRLDVMIQVNTSGEAQKSGVAPGVETLALARHVTDACVNLRLAGLMTIGSFGHDDAEGPNPDFLRLLSTRSFVAEELGLPVDDLQLSMGMSENFEQAVRLGSTNLRVGSLIFGERDK